MKVVLVLYWHRHPHDARIINPPAAEIASRISDDLHKLCRKMELPLMLVLEQMSGVGIGVNWAACAQEYIVQDGIWLAVLKISRARFLPAWNMQSNGKNTSLSTRSVWKRPATYASGCWR